MIKINSLGDSECDFEKKMEIQNSKMNRHSIQSISSKTKLRFEICVSCKRMIKFIIVKRNACVLRRNIQPKEPQDLHLLK